MAVNNNFYLTLNELMSRAAKGQIGAVVDYASFVDAGKVLSAMSITDLTNEFLNPLMNKVQKTINDNPAYSGMLTDMWQGKMDYGVLETIMGHFYDVSKSCFDGATLTDGQSYTDQFKVNLPEKTVIYHTDSNSYELDITVRDTDLRASFTSPNAMNSFIGSIFTDVANSLAFAEEQGRLNAFDAVVKRVAGETENSTDETAAAQRYNLLSIYNAKMGTSLTKADCLYNDSFVRFAVATMKDVAKLMEKPSTKFNSKGSTGFVTFTPASYRKVKIASIFEKAISVSLIDAYNRMDALLGMEYESLPYWQNIADRLRITTNASGSTTYSDSIIGVIYDNRAVGMMTQLLDTEATRNAKYKYTNYHYQQNYMFWQNEYANAVVFTIG